MRKGQVMSKEQKQKIREAALRQHAEGRGSKKGFPLWAQAKGVALRRGVPLSPEHRKKLSLAHIGKKMTTEQRVAMSIARKGKCPANILNGIFKGDKNYNWKGGITPEVVKIRNSIKMKRWREAIFRRDDWTCLKCRKRGVFLHADHIKPFAYYPKLRFELSNGQTLCVPCHREKTRDDGKKYWVNQYTSKNA